MTGRAFQPGHDLARLQQAFDEEAASLRVKSLLVRRTRSAAPEPASQVMAHLRRETGPLALALAGMAVAFIGIYVAIPA